MKSFSKKKLKSILSKMTPYPKVEKLINDLYIAVNGPGRAGLVHFYLAHGHNGLGIMGY